jgi:hypothetical protein
MSISTVIPIPHIGTEWPKTTATVGPIIGTRFNMYTDSVGGSKLNLRTIFKVFLIKDCVFLGMCRTFRDHLTEKLNKIIDVAHKHHKNGSKVQL